MVTLSRNIESPLFILSLSPSVLRVGNYFSVPHFLLLVPLSFLPFTVPPFPSPLPLSFLPFFFFFWWHFFFSLSQSLSFYFIKFHSIKYELFKSHRYWSLVHARGFISHATYRPHKTSSCNKSMLKFYLRIKPHVVIRVLNLPWKEKKRKEPSLDCFRTVFPLYVTSLLSSIALKFIGQGLRVNI